MITTDEMNRNNDSVSTLLISSSLASYLNHAVLKNKKSLKVYFHKLMSDPDLSIKLKRLRSSKWKCQFQSAGSDLIRFNFRPSRDDWAKLSILSHGSGFSRCYIFVFLMLIDLGLMRLHLSVFNNVGTPMIINWNLSAYKDYELSCSVTISKNRKIMKRIVKINKKTQINNQLK